MSEWKPARARQITAVRYGRVIWLTAQGVKPTPCYEVEFQQAMIEIFPPQWNLVWREKPRTVCIQVPVAYRVSKTIPAAGYTDVVVVHHAGGTEHVRIVDLPLEVDEKAAGAGTVYTGTSSDSFQAAYADALSQIPAAPDEVVRTEVVSQRGLHGGFLGFNLLSVSIRHLRGPGAAAGEAGGAERAAAQGGAGEAADAPRERPCDHVTRYHAEQNLYDVIIHAEGENPSTGWTQRFVQRPERIWPPNFEVVHRAPTGPTLPVLTPFSIHTSFPSSQRVHEVTVYDGRGAHRVEVEQVPDV
jgi:hypothetical protein